MFRDEFRDVCFTLLTRDPDLTNIGVLTAVSGFLDVCRGSEVFVIVKGSRGRYESFLLFRLPKKNAAHCRKLAEAILNASLYPKVQSKEVRCPSV